MKLWGAIGGLVVLAIAGVILGLYLTGVFQSPIKRCAEKEGMVAKQITRKYVQSVIDKHADMILRQPNLNGFGTHSTVDMDDLSDISVKLKGIGISVTKKVDQGTLPEEDRIPDCLDGVPVFWMEESPGILAPQSASEE